MLILSLDYMKKLLTARVREWVDDGKVRVLRVYLGSSDTDSGTGRTPRLHKDKLQGEVTER